jgi:hypothetical protein
MDLGHCIIPYNSLFQIIKDRSIQNRCENLFLPNMVCVIDGFRNSDSRLDEIALVKRLIGVSPPTCENFGVGGTQVFDSIPVDFESRFGMQGAKKGTVTKWITRFDCDVKFLKAFKEFGRNTTVKIQPPCRGAPLTCRTNCTKEDGRHRKGQICIRHHDRSLIASC